MAYSTSLGIQTLTAGATNVFFRFMILFKSEMIFTDSIFARLKYAPFYTLRMAFQPHATTRMIRVP